MKIKNMTTKARYLAIGLIALEIASIPVSAQIIDKYAFSKPQKVAAVPFPAEVGITKFLVSSDAPFAIISEDTVGEFDVRVKVYKADDSEPKVSFPQFKPQRRVPGQDAKRGKWQAYFAGMFRAKTGIK